MAEYRIKHLVTSPEAPDYQAILSEAYKRNIRPLCLCREPHPEMYIALINGQYVVKRMPNSAKEHQPWCDSYEPPAELSGLGEVLGAAIQENPETHESQIKVDFALVKRPGGKPPTPSDKESDTVKGETNKLSLRGFLHYLWDKAEFSRWRPGMAGKRSWRVIHHYLLGAASMMEAKKMPVAELLYVPEPWDKSRQDEINQRRLARFLSVSSEHKGAKQLLVVVGEVKEFGVARYGFKITVKHMPDKPIMLNEDLEKRLKKRFSDELDLWGMDESAHLVLVGTISVTRAGYVQLEEGALMVTDENWLPVESEPEKFVIGLLVDQKRSFVRGMRYNLTRHRPLALAVLSDTPRACAMYVIPPQCSDEYREALAILIAESDLDSWVWDVENDASMPVFPEAMNLGLPRSSRSGHKGHPERGENHG